MPRLENGLLVFTKGYAWLPDKRRALGRRTVGTRLGGMPAVGLEGPEAARFLYDEKNVVRSGALPEPVQATLFGKGAVHSLDGEAHRVRKAMFVALLMREDGIASLVQRTTAAWDDAAADWATRPEIVLFDASAEVIADAVTRWAGVPLTDDEVPDLARDLLALVDGFATGGPRHFRARRARKRREAWLAELVEGVRGGTATVDVGSAVEVVARHQDADGALLDPRVAAVELLNVIRPTTAVAWFVAYSAHALIRWPDNRKRLADGDAAFAEAFGHEVRRFYPFPPVLRGRAARARAVPRGRAPAEPPVPPPPAR